MWYKLIVCKLEHLGSWIDNSRRRSVTKLGQIINNREGSARKSRDQDVDFFMGFCFLPLPSCNCLCIEGLLWWSSAYAQKMVVKYWHITSHISPFVWILKNMEERKLLLILRLNRSCEIFAFVSQWQNDGSWRNLVFGFPLGLMWNCADQRLADKNSIFHPLWRVCAQIQYRKVFFSEAPRKLPNVFESRL